MNWILWILIWTIVSAVPISKLLKRKEDSGDGQRYLGTTILSTGVGFVVGVCTLYLRLPDGIIVWILFLVKFVLMTVEGVWNEKRRYTIVAFVLLIIISIAGVGTLLFSGLNNAKYFARFIDTSDELPFQTELPDNFVRLTTEELARSIARQHMSEFGSNVKILSTHITTYEERLVWINTIGSTNTMAQNYVFGFVIVDVNNPDAPPIIIHERLDLAEGLWITRDIHLVNYLGNTEYAFGRAYPTQDEDGRWRYIQTYYHVDMGLVRRFAGVLVIDKDGNVIERYGRGDIPMWITQPYDENSFLEGGINDWGHHKRGDGFDFWASGLLFFIAPSQDRLSMTEDTRYVYDPDLEDIVGLAMVHPIGNDKALAGIFKASRTDITYHDVSDLGLMSGTRASQWIEGRIPKPSVGYHYAAMPLLYPLNIGNETRSVWYIPFYWTDSLAYKENVRLAGFGIVDGRETDTYVLNIISEGMGGEKLVTETKRDFIALVKGEVPEEEKFELNGTVEYKEDYVIDGNTRWAIGLRLENGTVVETTAKAETLTQEDINDIARLQVGNEATFLIDRNNEIIEIVD